MSLNIFSQYPGRATAPTAGYPYGSSKNETAPLANDGTPYDLARANDIFGLQQALLKQLGIVPTGTADTAIASQYFEGLLKLASLGTFFVDTGVADAYDVAPIGADLQVQTAYYDSLEVNFVVTNANTGAATLDVWGVGPAALTLPGGTALLPGALAVGDYAQARYDLANTRFNLLAPVKAAGTFVATSAYNAIAPSPYADLNLSSIVGAQQRMVYLRVINNSGGTASLLFRTKGHASPVGLPAGCASATLDNTEVAYILVKTDASGVIQWGATAIAGTTQIFVEHYA